MPSVPPQNFLKLRGADGPSSQLQDNVNATLKPIAENLGRTPIMGAPPPAWIQPDLLNGWVNSTTKVGYHRDALGYVHVKGRVQNSTAGLLAAAIMTFPKSYRPLETHVFAVLGNGGATNFVSLAPSGDATLTVGVAAAGTCWFEFSFLAEA